MKKVILLVLLALVVGFTYAVILKSGHSSTPKERETKYKQRSNCVYAYQ